jgi:hypothetical protein
MHFVIQHFGNNEKHNSKDSYKAVERIFYEQCEVHEEAVIVKKKTGGSVMQNPSDPDATYDGHKGQGYQVQIAETCNPENEVQLITYALPQTAAQLDTTATDKALDSLEETELLPQEMFADTHYCSDENIQTAAHRGVELVGPVQCGGLIDKDVEHLNVDDFDIDEETEEVACCPAGHKPASSIHDRQSGKTKTVMLSSTCLQCEFRKECPVEKSRDGYRLYHTAKQRRLAGRRREEDTDVFRDRYRIRGGIEGTNSGLKRKTGLGRLRVRGKEAVYHAVYLKIAGWNILRASVCAKMRAIVWERANMVAFWLDFVPVRVPIIAVGVRMDVKRRFLLHCLEFRYSSKLSIAA